MNYTIFSVSTLVIGIFIISLAELLYDYLDRVDSTRIIDKVINFTGFMLTFAGLIMLFILVVSNLIIYNGTIP